MIKKVFKGTVLGSALLSGLLFFVGCGGVPENGAAVVNGVVITKDEIAKRVAVAAGVYTGKVSNDPNSEEYQKFQRDVTQQLVDEELQRQEAVKRGITVSSDEVEDVLEQVVEDKYLGNQAKMEADYASRGIGLEELRADFRRRLQFQKLLDDIKEEVKPSEEELLALYESSKNKYVYPERRQVRQLLVADEAAAQSVITRVAAGEDFADLAQQLSLDAKAKENGGLIGLVPRESLPEALGAAAFSLPTNQLSAPVKTDQGWYVLRVELVTPPSNRSFDDVKSDLGEFTANQRMANRYREVVEEYTNSADIEYAVGYEPAPAEETTATTEAGV